MVMPACTYSIALSTGGGISRSPLGKKPRVLRNSGLNCTHQREANRRHPALVLRSRLKSGVSEWLKDQCCLINRCYSGRIFLYLIYLLRKLVISSWGAGPVLAHSCFKSAAIVHDSVLVYKQCAGPHWAHLGPSVWCASTFVWVTSSDSAAQKWLIAALLCGPTWRLTWRCGGVTEV